MTTKIIIEGSANASNARAAAFGLIAHCFRYPDHAWRAELRDGRRWAGWVEALDDADGALHECLRTLRSLAEETEPEEVYRGYAALFGHTVRGACPPYEMEFGAEDIVQRASDLADIAGFYAAFGLDVRPDAQERADHLSVECEFMSALQSREAWALASGEAEAEAVCRDASRKFLRDHLARWLPAFARRVMEADGEGFHGQAARFAAAFIQEECGRLDIPVGSPYLEIRPSNAEQESEQSCGVPTLGGTGPAQPLVQLNIPSRTSTTSALSE